MKIQTVMISLSGAAFVKEKLRVVINVLKYVDSATC